MDDPRDDLKRIYRETTQTIKQIDSKEKLIEGIKYFYTLVESNGLNVFELQKDQMSFSELETLLDRLIREVSNRDFINWVKTGKKHELAEKYNLKLKEIVLLN